MTDLEAAQQVRDGTLPSGSQFGNGWLFALRISGTGMAERPALAERVYRNPALWLTDEMRQRANGLPIIMGHPTGGVLNSDEFAGRVIGTIVLPYVSGAELWGVARILDENAASLMAAGKFSTSPGVMVPTAAVEGEAGTLVIEKNPALLDHLAIVPNDGAAGGGVWDKGGPGTGVRADSIHSERIKAVPEETKPSDGEKLDKLLAGLDGLSTMCQSMASRLDALEKRGDGAKKPDAVKKDGVADMPGDPMQTAADAMTPAERNEAERKAEAEKSEAQARADSVAQAFGEQAPPPMAGERTLAYRQRLAKRFQRYCKAFDGVDLAAISDAKLFDGVETKIYADALQASLTPEVAPGMPLREIVKTDATGRRVSTFYGNHTFFCDMKLPSARVKQFYDWRPRAA